MSVGFDYTYDVPWYSHPVQVRYYPEVDCKLPRYGIAFHDTLVDGEFGEVYSITELVSKYNNTEGKEKCISELSWVDLEDVIETGKFYK